MNQNTAKQEAERIIEMFQNELSGVLYSPHNNVSAKNCARIHVQGIIDALKHQNPNFEDNTYWSPIDFWQQVLHHIQTKI